MQILNHVMTCRRAPAGTGKLGRLLPRDAVPASRPCHRRSPCRTELSGQPDEVKQLFMSNATSLGRHEFSQGAGLIDLMRVLSNV